MNRRHVTIRALEYLCFQVHDSKMEGTTAPCNVTGCGEPFVAGRDVTIANVRTRANRTVTCDHCLILWDTIVEGRSLELRSGPGKTFAIAAPRPTT
jgi:hypothetical protein